CSCCAAVVHFREARRPPRRSLSVKKLAALAALSAAFAIAACEKDAAVRPDGVIGSEISTGVVISQVYGGGGNVGATRLNDYIELFNRGNSAVSLAGWTVQYTGSTGTTWGSAKTALSASIASGSYYLVVLGS